MKMRIKLPREQLLLNTFRFSGTGAAGSWMGSGFVARHDVPGRGTEYFLVTNRHVASGAETADCLIATCRGSFPHSCELAEGTIIKVHRDQANGWFGHPDPAVDVAVYRLRQDPRFHNDQVGALSYATISTEIFAPSSPEVDFCAEVVFVGYPSGRMDETHTAPIFRRGSVASTPSLDWNGQRCFLIDASVFPGSSGSPVFAPDDKGSVQFVGRQFTLLGIVTATLTYNAAGELVAHPVPVSRRESVSFRDFLDLGVVTKATCILETIRTTIEGSAPLV